MQTRESMAEAPRAMGTMTKLFILHGWTYQTSTWDALRAELAARGVENEFLLIPGLTDGINPPPAGGWTLEDYVQWLEQKTVAYEKVILWGHSNGGRISLAFAATYPEKVARLILEDSAGIPPEGLRKLKRDIFRNLSAAGRVFPRLSMLRKMLYKLIRENDYERATPEMKKTLACLVAVDLRTILGRIHCPTLIIWGAKDTITPLKNGEEMHRGIANSRMLVLPDAAHSPHITHAKEVADLIEAEIKDV